MKEKIIRDTIKAKGYKEELMITLLGKAILDVFKLQDKVKNLKAWNWFLLAYGVSVTIMLIVSNI